jgi:hypothetical protein
MTQRRVCDPAVDMGGDREGRVHQHDARPHGVIQKVVDVRSVVPRYSDTREQAVEQAGARAGELVQDQAAACELGVDGKQARAGGRLEHEVGGHDRRRDIRDEAEPEGRRELLEHLALLGPPRVRRQQRHHLGQHGEERRW